MFSLFLTVLNVQGVNRNFPLLLKNTVYVLVKVSGARVVITLSGTNRCMSPSALHLSFEASSGASFQAHFTHPASVIKVPSSQVRIADIIQLAP